MESSSSVCARCTKPIEGEATKIGKYKYGPCCIEIVKARKEKE